MRKWNGPSDVDESRCNCVYKDDRDYGILRMKYKLNP